jgi:hypothetical protein
MPAGGGFRKRAARTRGGAGRAWTRGGAGGPHVERGEVLEVLAHDEAERGEHRHAAVDKLGLAPAAHVADRRVAEEVCAAVSGGGRWEGRREREGGARARGCGEGGRGQRAAAPRARASVVGRQGRARAKGSERPRPVWAAGGPAAPGRGRRIGHPIARRHSLAGSNRLGKGSEMPGRVRASVGRGRGTGSTRGERRGIAAGRGVRRAAGDADCMRRAPRQGRRGTGGRGG